jgi:cytochrome c peroxidase
VLRSRAYSGEKKPRFDFGYPGSTEAAGEALVLVSLLFGEEVDGTSRDQVAPRISQNAGPVDCMNVYNQGHRPESNWDNVIEAVAARTQTAELATTGTVDQIDLEATSVITNYIQALPPEPYPFAVDTELARRGRDLFDEHCVTCHYPGNRERYGQIATGMNRFNQFNAFTWKATRLALRAACPRESHVESFGEGPANPSDFQDNEILTDTPGATGADRGYAATALYGLWTSSPYLHNGSILTLLEVLAPRHRRATYVRGTLAYDTGRVGLLDAAVAGIDPRVRDAWQPELSEDQLQERFKFDSSLDGLSNVGHDSDLTIGGKKRKLDWGSDVYVDKGGKPLALPGSDLAALLEYLKTL